MKKLNFLVMAMSCIAGLVVSCHDYNDEDNLISTSSDSFESRAKTGDDKFTVLGDVKTIPCSVGNMAEAYKRLLDNPTATLPPTRFDVTTTHLYVKFSPQDSIQYEKIINDTVLNVSDEPFEYNINVEGSIYLDPRAVDSTFTSYYSVVPKDYAIPVGVPYKVIEDLYFTNEDDFGDEPSEKDSQLLDFYEDLNLEALKISDNLEGEENDILYYFRDANNTMTYKEAINAGFTLSDLNIDFKKTAELEDKLDNDFNNVSARRRKWHPSGDVTVEEDQSIGVTVGVMGAKIKVRKWGWLVIKTATTDRNGHFSTSSTRTKRVKYACYFKHEPNFIVKAGTFFWNARDRGHSKHKRKAWKRNYTYGRRQLYAFVQNAAFDYYDRIYSTYNIKRPANGINISAKYNMSGTSHHVPQIVSTLLPVSRIRVTRKNSSGNYRGSDGIYATTVHELTHAGHQRMDPGMFSIFESGSCNRAILMESWAEGVETMVTNDRYMALTSSYQSTNSSDNFGRWNSFRQRYTASQMSEYTPIVEDLIDNLNQNLVNASRPADRVSGYTLAQIQGALDNSRSIDDWENKLRNNYTNATEIHLTELFDYVRFVRNNNLSTPCN